MPKAIKHANSKAAEIRKYITANPRKTVSEVAVACGVKYQRVYAVKKEMERKGWKQLDLFTSNVPMPKLPNLPEVGDTVGGLVFTRLSNGRFRWMAPKPIEAPPVQLEMFEPKADPVNHPAHYKVGGIETIDFIEAKKLNYNMGNAVKYITRADHKGNRKQDLEKAIWYIKRELDHSM